MAETVAGNDPKELLLVHDAFRSDGALRPLVHFHSGRTVGELTDLTMTEEAFRKLLALSPDLEMEALAGIGRNSIRRTK
jgi:hypothetical protein